MMALVFATALAQDFPVVLKGRSGRSGRSSYSSGGSSTGGSGDGVWTWDEIITFVAVIFFMLIGVCAVKMRQKAVVNQQEENSRARIVHSMHHTTTIDPDALTVKSEPCQVEDGELMSDL